MLVVFQLLARCQRKSLALGRFGGVLSGLGQRLKPRVSLNYCLLFLLACYIVASRIGPFVSRAGDFAIASFDVERRIVEEFDHDALRLFREAFTKFRVVTRAPYPVVLFGRAPTPPDYTPLLTAVCTMGASKSKQKTVTSKTQTTTDTQTSSEPVKTEQKDVAPLTQDPQTTEKNEEKREKIDEKDARDDGQKKENSKSSTEESGEKSPSPSTPLPLKRLDELRDESSSLSLHLGSTESIVGLCDQERLNPAEHKNKPVKFKKIQPTIQTGDLALLYRRDLSEPHLAIFINHVESDPLFPLLLVKGKTKPLPLAKFEPRKPRFIHPITATTRIFYGDYEKVAIQYIQLPDGMSQITPEQAMDAINAVEAIPFSERERQAIAAAETDQERSLYMSTYMAAYYYQKLGIFKGSPDLVTPTNIRSQLPLLEPIYVRLPSVKLGPMVHGDPPFLKQLVDGIYPAHDVQLVPYEEAIRGLDTGDLILFSGATSQGAIIKFFDHSQFSHVAVVLKAKYTSQLLLWEASTNHAKLVDVQAGSARTGVEVLPLRNKIFSGWYDRVAVRRLLNMTPEKRQQIYEVMLKLRKEWMGRSYEKNLVQMALSAINPSDMFLSLFQNTQEDLSSLFCSELVAAAYQRMNLIKNDRPSNTYTPDDFSSTRDSRILCEGVELSKEVYIELKWPATVLSTQHSIY